MPNNANWFSLNCWNTYRYWIYNEFICWKFSILLKIYSTWMGKIGVLTGSLLSTLAGYFLIL